jgi:hypothetical protein
MKGSGQNYDILRLHNVSISVVTFIAPPLPLEKVSVIRHRPMQRGSSVLRQTGHGERRHNAGAEDVSECRLAKHRPLVDG